MSSFDRINGSSSWSSDGQEWLGLNLGQFGHGQEWLGVNLGRFGYGQWGLCWWLGVR